MLNMVTSIDGAVTVEGGSTALSDDDDRRLFHALRTVPDVILVGAGTVRNENYRPVTLDEERRSVRRGRGLEPSPRLVIVSGSLDLDPSSRVFSDPDHRPAILTGSQGDPARIRQLEEVATVEVLPELDGAGIIAHLAGAGVILCEGGPTLNGHLLAAEAVDEVNWTVSPMLVGGDGPGMALGVGTTPPVEMSLTRAWRGDRSLFLRFVRAG